MRDTHNIMPEQKTTTILFDLGNVVLDLDYSKTINGLKALLEIDYDPFDKKSNALFLKYGTGKISEDLFLNYLIRHARKGTQAIDLIRAWNAMLLGIRPETMDLLYELKARFTLLVYSNTNQTHLRWVYQYLEREYGMTDWVPGIFKTAYYSHELGFRKPDKKGFIAILEREDLKPGEVLFIDDHKDFVDQAMTLGIKGLHKPEGEDLRMHLVNKGVI